MNRVLSALAAAALLMGASLRARLEAAVPVVWDGTAGPDVSADPDSNDKWRWEAGNWTKDGVLGQTAQATMGDTTGGRGGVDIVIGGGAQVYFDQNRPCPSDQVCVVGALGDFKPRSDLNGPSSLTIKEGALLSMVSKTDSDGRWMRVAADITLDNGTLRRTYSAPSGSGGQIFLGYQNEVLRNQKINVNVINGGRLENDGKLCFGRPDYFASAGGSGGHSPGIEVAMTINNGTLDLTGGGYPDYPFGLISGELLFAYEYEEGVGPKNEKYSINFTGPGSITVDPHYDNNAGQYLGGIYVIQQDSNGAYSPLGGAPDFYTPIGYEDLWNLGILQANGQSGMTGATFSNFFTTTGDKFNPNYTLTSLLAAPGLDGDYNEDGRVDAADYVVWRKSDGSAAGYTEWRTNFGRSGASGAALDGGSPVPEPASWVVLVFGFTATCLGRRYSRT
jgi:hypothetical protein